MDSCLVRNYLPALNQYFPSVLSFLTLEYLIGFYSQEKQEVINEIDYVIRGKLSFIPLKETYSPAKEILNVIFYSKELCYCKELLEVDSCFPCLDTYTCPNPLFGKKNQKKVLFTAQGNNKRARI